MGSNERRERERLETRSKILDAARELFVAHGYEHVTMRKIAEKIEYSPTAIYAYFKDKNALVQELCNNDFHGLAEHFLKLAQVEDPVERLQRVGVGYVDFALRYPNQYKLMFLTPTPKDGAEWEKLHEANKDHDPYLFLRLTVEELIEQGRLRPELKDASLVTQVLWASMHGIVALHITKRGHPWVDWRPPHKAAAIMIEALLRGMRREG